MRCVVRNNKKNKKMDGIKSDYLTKMQLFDELLDELAKAEDDLRTKDIPYTDDEDCSWAYVNGIAVGRISIWRFRKLVNRMKKKWLEDEAS